MDTINGISALNDFMTPNSWNEFTNKVTEFLLKLKTDEGFNNTLEVTYDNSTKKLILSEKIGTTQTLGYLSLPPDQIFKIIIKYSGNLSEINKNNFTEQVKAQIVSSSNGTITLSDIESVELTSGSIVADIVFKNSSKVAINPDIAFQLITNMKNQSPISLGSNTYAINEMYYRSDLSPCLSITNKNKCDSQTEDISCYWQNDKCHVDYNDDTTDCNFFTSKGEYYCPENNCIWNNNNCVSKTHTPIVTQQILAKTHPITGNNIKCEAINTSLDENIRKSECGYFDCHWDEELKLCADNINRGCEIKNTKDQCLTNNINVASSQNRCKWIPNIGVDCASFDATKCSNNSQICNLDGQNCFSKNPLDGFCLDNNTEIPCHLYSKDSCPTKHKVDVYGNLTQYNQCQINSDNKCVKSNNNTMTPKCETYSFLGDCPTDNCQSVEINSQSLDGQPPLYTKNICVDKNRLPCSSLETENCLGENSKYCHLDDNDQCVANINDISFIHTTSNNNFMNNLDNSIVDFKHTSGGFNNFMTTNTPIIGEVLQSNGTYEISNSSGNGIHTIKTTNNSSSKLSVGDEIIIQVVNSSIKDSFKIIDINNTNNVYTLGLDKHIAIQASPNQDGKLPVINWIVIKPKSNLYNSYSNLTSIKDSMQIDNYFDSQ